MTWIRRLAGMIADPLKRHWGFTELALALGCAVLARWWFGDGADSRLQDALRGNRSVLYGTIAAVSGSLFGFVLAAGAIMVPMLESPRLKRVRESTQYSSMWRMFLAATRGLGLLTLASVAALIVDSDAHAAWAMTYAVLFLSVLSALQVATCMWILENIVTILARRPGEG